MLAREYELWSERHARTHTEELTSTGVTSAASSATTLEDGRTVLNMHARMHARMHVHTNFSDITSESVVENTAVYVNFQY